MILKHFVAIHPYYSTHIATEIDEPRHDFIIQPESIKLVHDIIWWQDEGMSGNLSSDDSSVNVEDDNNSEDVDDDKNIV